LAPPNDSVSGFPFTSASSSDFAAAASGQRPGREILAAEGKLRRLDSDETYLGGPQYRRFQNHRVAIHNAGDGGSGAGLKVTLS